MAMLGATIGVGSVALGALEAVGIGAGTVVACVGPELWAAPLGSEPVDAQPASTSTTTAAVARRHMADVSNLAISLTLISAVSRPDPPS
jgi:hypothetical protein